MILSEGRLNTWIHINLGWGMVVALCVYGTFQTSGGHMNPAVSLAMVTLGRLSIRHFPYYCLVQTLGAFAGAALSYCVYYGSVLHGSSDSTTQLHSDELINFTDGVLTISGPRGTAGIFTSFPKEHITLLTAFTDQVVGTAMLVLFIVMIIDKRNKIPTCMQPLLFGLSLFVVGASYGMNVGYPINPARDLGPRLFTLWAGYGWEVFS
jgi:MIP family channel proteins